MPIDFISLRDNCAEYSRAHKAKEVLKLANGRRSYAEIAAITRLHPTRTSGLLAKAEKLGLATRVKSGIYKKTRGILTLLGAPTKTRQEKTVDELVRRVKKVKGSVSNGFTLSSASLVNPEKMMKAYAYLFATENSLRQLIRKVFANQQSWWQNAVPPAIQRDILTTKSKTPYHAAKRADELEYAHLGQLKEIIINGKNWNSFLPYLKNKNKNAFAVTIDKAIASRNAIGHCIPLQPKDLRIVDVRFEDILTMLN